MSGVSGMDDGDGPITGEDVQREQGVAALTAFAATLPCGYCHANPHRDICPTGLGGDVTTPARTLPPSGSSGARD